MKVYGGEEWGFRSERKICYVCRQIGCQVRLLGASQVSYEDSASILVFWFEFSRSS